MGKTGRRFRLVPLEEKSAMEQLWEAADYAVRYLYSLRRLGGLSEESRHELWADWKLRTVKHFLEYKVGKHTYCRQTAQGTPLDLFDNVLSSAWSSFRGAIEWHKKHWLEPAVNTDDIDRALPGTDLRFCDLIGDDYTNKLRYGTLHGNQNVAKKLPTHNPVQRKNLYENTWEIVCEDREMLGLEPITFDDWIKLVTEDGDSVDEAVMVNSDPGDTTEFWFRGPDGRRHLTERGREWNRVYRQKKREAARKLREERAKCWDDPDYFPPENARKK